MGDTSVWKTVYSDHHDGIWWDLGTWLMSPGTGLGTFLSGWSHWVRESSCSNSSVKLVGFSSNVYKNVDVSYCNFNFHSPHDYWHDYWREHLFYTFTGNFMLFSFCEIIVIICLYHKKYIFSCLSFPHWLVVGLYYSDNKSFAHVCLCRQIRCWYSDSILICRLLFHFLLLTVSIDKQTILI